MIGIMFIHNVKQIIYIDKNPRFNQSDEINRSLFKYSPPSDSNQPKFTSQINNYIGNQLNRNSLTSLEHKIRNFSPYTLGDYKHKYDGAFELSKGLGDNMGTKEWQAREEMRRKIRNYSEQINSRNHTTIKPLCLPPKDMREKNLLDQMKSSSKYKAMEYGKDIIPYKNHKFIVENEIKVNENDKWKKTYDREEMKNQLNKVYFQSLNNRLQDNKTKDKKTASNYIHMIHNFKEDLI